MIYYFWKYLTTYIKNKEIKNKEIKNKEIKNKKVTITKLIIIIKKIYCNVKLKILKIIKISYLRRNIDESWKNV